MRDLDDEMLEEELERVVMEEKYEENYCRKCDSIHAPEDKCEIRNYKKSLDEIVSRILNQKG